MERLEDTFLVAGVSREQCFEYIVDPDNGAEWASFAKEIRAHGERGPGRTIEARVGFLGLTFGVAGHVATWEEPRAYVIAGKVPFYGELGAHLREVEQGTEVDAHLMVEPGRYFPVPGMVLRKALRRQFDRDVGALKHHLRALA